MLVNQQSGSLKYRRGALTTVISFLLLCLTMSRSHLRSQAPPRFRAAVRISTVSILKLSLNVVQSATVFVFILSPYHSYWNSNWCPKHQFLMETLVVIVVVVVVVVVLLFFFSFWGLPILICSELLSKAAQLLKLSLTVVQSTTVSLLKLSITVVQNTTALYWDSHLVTKAPQFPCWICH